MSDGSVEAWFVNQIITVTDGTLIAYLKISGVNTVANSIDLTGVNNYANPEGSTLNSGLTTNALLITPGSRGADGTNSYGRSNQSLVVPTTAQTATITLNNGVTTGWFPGQVITFTDSTNQAFLEITAINSSTEFEVTGTANKGNTPGITLNPGSATNGLLITPGDKGTDGVDSYARSNQSLIVPTAAATTTVTLSQGVTVAWFVGQVITFADSTNKAFLEITAINSATEVEVTGVNNVGNTPGTTLNSGLATGGLLITPGDKGVDGINAYGRSSQSLVIPTSVATTTVTLNEGLTSAWFVGQVLSFSDSTNKAFLEITAINSPAEIEVTGTDGKGNTPGTTLNSGLTTNGLIVTPGDRASMEQTGLMVLTALTEWILTVEATKR